MLIGVPKETKNHEYRVGLTPAGVAALVAAGHRARVQSGAGFRTGFPDGRYVDAGAEIVATAGEVFAADLVVKVKELQPDEFRYLREGLILFCYLHLATAPEFARQLVERRATAVGYETVTGPAGELPLLTPMSQVAGRLAVLAGAWALTTPNGGSGVLLPGVPGVAPAKVLILGGGVVGSNAARMAIGLGADVTLLDRNPARMGRLQDALGSALKTRCSDASSIEALVPDADLVIGAVLVPGKRAPKLISRELVAAMRPGSVLVDVSIDQGGCAETSRPTSHSEPLYVEEGVVHYCVTNIPSATARTSTLALTQATLPYALRLADLGVGRALSADPGFAGGLQVHLGTVTHPGVAEDLGYSFTPVSTVLGA
ncbi:MAG: alanine dehydrogenase [Betaproteobacteria bacterium]|nr:alanine dehydrogenase [Betaproteobacteria bacterium]